MKYANLINEFRDVAEITRGFREMLAAGAVFNNPVEIDMYAQMATRHIHIMLILAPYLLNHPEWAEELDRLLIEPGCPAFKVPIVEKFLEDKAKGVGS